MISVMTMPVREQQPMMPETLLTPIQVAARLNKSVDAVRKMIGRGMLPGAVKLGREWRIKASMLDRFIDNLPEY